MLLAIYLKVTYFLMQLTYYYIEVQSIFAAAAYAKAVTLLLIILERLIYTLLFGHSSSSLSLSPSLSLLLFSISLIIYLHD